MRDPGAIIQPAVDLDQAGAEIDRLLGRIGDGEAFVGTAQRALHEWRCQVGDILRRTKAGRPSRGPTAKVWGDFVRDRGLTLDTATNYMKLAEHRERYPVEAATMGTTDAYRALGITRVSRIDSDNSKKGDEGAQPSPERPPNPEPSTVEERPASTASAKKAKPKGEREPLFDGPVGEMIASKPTVPVSPPLVPAPAPFPVPVPAAAPRALVVDDLPLKAAEPAEEAPVVDEVPALRAEIESLRGQLAEAVERAETAECELATLRCALVPSVTRAPSPAQEPTYELDTPGSLDGDLQSIARGIRGVTKMWPFGRKRIGALLRLLTNEVDP